MAEITREAMTVTEVLESAVAWADRPGPEEALRAAPQSAQGRSSRKMTAGRPVVVPPGVLSGVFPARPVGRGAGPV